jgi:pre-rRNA-processing protein IPI3
MSRFEIIVSASAGEGVDVYDLRSGAHMRSFPAQLGDTVALDADHVLVAHRDKAAATVWSLRNGRQKVKSSLREKLSVVVTSRDGALIVGGTVAGNLYLWNAASGALLRTWPAHFKAVAALSFTNDGSFLLSGGVDAMVAVWNVNDLMASDSLSPSSSSSFAPSSASSSSSSPSPTSVMAHVEWSAHALTITGIVCGGGSNGGGVFGGGGGGVTSRVFTSSLDGTVKMWDIATRALVHSFVFPTYINAVALDPGGGFLFAGGGDSNVYMVDLITGSSAVQASATDATSSTAAAGGDTLRFTGHGKAVTDLAVSYDASLLVSSSDDGTVRVWDVRSRQTVRTLSRHRKSCARVHVLFDHASLRTSSAVTAAPGGSGGGGGGNGGLSANDEQRQTQQNERHASSAATTWPQLSRQPAVAAARNLCVTVPLTHCASRSTPAAVSTLPSSFAAGGAAFGSGGGVDGSAEDDFWFGVVDSNSRAVGASATAAATAVAGTDDLQPPVAKKRRKKN